MKMLKGCAWYLLFMATLHTVVGLILDFDSLAAMLRDGVGTIDQPHEDRLAALWFMFSGALMFIVAGFTFWSVRVAGSLPTFLGPVFLLMGAVGGYIIPDSGLWLYIPIGLFLLIRNAPGKKTAVHA
ncbi:DUF6463 family protein [Pseudodesulfovibrio sp. zrk46]|uniref:DUF6463 family protein n=1 Tax=Pseudodesulfovibrio sp. zrk46 TaxID=2725288 RepID=UPI0014490817|nr:DUF6463 family protein [Pseudodesulfovibrio sp. zrk46]QJB57099.1 hypothetical protein HFN16_12100 [Pseudodesulfovibrio sp. zrk46]